MLLLLLTIIISIIIVVIIVVFIVIIIIISSSSSSSSSTQRSARGPVDEMHVFQKKVFSPWPEASFEVYFNATTHLLKLRFKKKEKCSRLGEMHLFEFTSMQDKHLLDLQRKSCKLNRIWTLRWAFDRGHEQTHFKFVFGVVYCVVFKQQLK